MCVWVAFLSKIWLLHGILSVISLVSYKIIKAMSPSRCESMPFTSKCASASASLHAATVICVKRSVERTCQIKTQLSGSGLNEQPMHRIVRATSNR